MPMVARQFLLNVHANVQQHVGSHVELVGGRPIAESVTSGLTRLTAGAVRRIAEGKVQADHAGGCCDHSGPRKRSREAVTAVETTAQRRMTVDAGGSAGDAGGCFDQGLRKRRRGAVEILLQGSVALACGMPNWLQFWPTMHSPMCCSED